MSEATEKKIQAESYFKQEPKSLDILKNNKQAWAFEHTRHIWELAEDAGFEFVRLDGCGMFHEALWINETCPMKHWNFNLTYRVKCSRSLTVDK